MTILEELLVDGCKILNLKPEPMLVVMACCRTKKQQLTMLDWMKKHYKENPSEDEVLKIAELIREKVKD